MHIWLWKSLLMTFSWLSFLLVGIEPKYEVTVGQLRRPGNASHACCCWWRCTSAPIYLALNASTAQTPIATDIAFALGVMSLLATELVRKPRSFSRHLHKAISGYCGRHFFYGHTRELPG